MITLAVILFILSIYFILQPNKTLKTAGKIMLGIILVPVIGFILLFVTCLAVIGGASLFK